jgi:hypothetical protein
MQQQHRLVECSAAGSSIASQPAQNGRGAHSKLPPLAHHQRPSSTLARGKESSITRDSRLVSHDSTKRALRGLTFRVRDGNGCIPLDMNARREESLWKGQKPIHG